MEANLDTPTHVVFEIAEGAEPKVSVTRVAGVLDSQLNMLIYLSNLSGSGSPKMKKRRIIESDDEADPNEFPQTLCLCAVILCI